VVSVSKPMLAVIAAVLTYLAYRKVNLD